MFLKLVNPQKSCANLVILTRGSHSCLPCWSYSCVPMRLGFGGEIKLFAANQSFCWVDFWISKSWNPINAINVARTPFVHHFHPANFTQPTKFQKKSSPSPLAVASNIIYHRRRWSRWLCDTKIEPPFASLPRRGRSQPWCLRIEAAKPGACFMGLSHMTYRKTIWKAPEKPVNWCWVYTFFRWFYMSKNDVSGEEAATHRKL